MLLKIDIICLFPIKGQALLGWNIKLDVAQRSIQVLYSKGQESNTLFKCEELKIEGEMIVLSKQVMCAGHLRSLEMGQNKTHARWNGKQNNMWKRGNRMSDSTLKLEAPKPNFHQDFIYLMMPLKPILGFWFNKVVSEVVIRCCQEIHSITCLKNKVMPLQNKMKCISNYSRHSIDIIKWDVAIRLSCPVDNP